ncbi:SDR family oxidoreductase [candidate division WOR-3 bacterium]|nr:SDR family oxidoreductase [candidate division WOR-3 bacterium]
MVGIDLSGRVALVTGGSRGLGRAAALALARAGADVAVNYLRDARAARHTASGCGEFGVRAAAIKADVSIPAEVKRLYAGVERQFRRLDILVANAGIWKGAAIEKMTDRQLAETLDLNVSGVFYCCREAVPLMRRSGGGRIVLVASTAGQRGEAFHSHYAASKGAIISLTKSLAPELAADHILVNCIAPGWFDTDMSRLTLSKPDSREQVIATIPLGRVGRPEEFAGAVLFLASELSTFVSGEILNVNGGAVLVG